MHGKQESSAPKPTPKEVTSRKEIRTTANLDPMMHCFLKIYAVEQGVSGVVQRLIEGLKEEGGP